MKAPLFKGFRVLFLGVGGLVFRVWGSGLRLSLEASLKEGLIIRCLQCLPTALLRHARSNLGAGPLQNPGHPKGG